MKKACILTVLMLSAAILFSGCSDSGPQASRPEIRLEFYSVASPVPSSQKAEYGIKESKWLDNKTLQVSALVKLNCGQSVESGDYELTGGKILLKYKVRPCDKACTDYECPFKITYRFNDIKKKDYTYELKRIN